jgi:large subunit ribosomal protein L29
MSPSPADLRQYSETELTTHIATARKEIFGLRFQNATGELENTANLRKQRRELARALTVLRQRGLHEPAKPVHVELPAVEAPAAAAEPTTETTSSTGEEVDG